MKKDYNKKADTSLNLQAEMAENTGIPALRALASPFQHLLCR